MVQLETANKRQRQADAKIQVLEVKSSQVDAVKAAATAEKRHDSRAENRSANTRPGGATFNAANKCTALNSERGGEMAGLDTALK